MAVQKIYPATRHLMKGAGIPLDRDEPDKAAELTHDFVVERLGKNNFKVTARIVTRDGQEIVRCFTNPGKKRRDLISDVVAIQHAARRINTTDDLFRVAFADGAQWKVVKHTDTDGKTTHRFFLFDPRQVNPDEAYRPFCLVSSFKNLWGTENENVYLGTSLGKGAFLGFDPTALVEAAPAFTSTGVKGFVGSLVGPMLSKIPGGVGKQLGDTFNTTSYDDYIDRIAKHSKTMTRHLDAQQRLWDQLDRGGDDPRFLRERLNQMKRGAGHSDEQKAEIKRLEAQLADT